MPELFQKLLISSPNGGGLIFVNDTKVFRLDGVNTTGLWPSPHAFLRGVQPDSLLIYDKNTPDIKDATGLFPDIHDVIEHGGSYYIVGTSGNEIIALNPDGSELQRWVFPGDKDSRHINCLAIWNNRIIFSAFCELNETRAYKGKTLGAGYIQDLASGKKIITSLSQPHSPISLGLNLLVANSEQGELREYSPQGNLLRTKQLDGYTRGICISDKIIYIGLSRSRNIEAHGIETAEIVALDKESWQELDRLSLPVNEIYSIVSIQNESDLVNTISTIAEHSSSQYEDRILSLSTSVIDRDVQIANFSQVISEHESNATNLNTALAEREIQIEHLGQAISERESNVTNLNTALAERDIQIEYLGQAISERELNVANLHAALTEREIQIINLGEAISEYETQVTLLKSSATHEQEILSARLKNLVDEHDNQIFDLQKAATDQNTEVEELLKTLKEIKTSTSWRITHPLRTAGKLKLLKRKASKVIGRRTELLSSYFKLINCPLFNASWYLSQYPDVAKNKLNPLWHYLINGWKEGRRPSMEFDGQYYLARYPDISGQDQAPLLHYWLHGRHEGRHPNSTLDLDWHQNQVQKNPAVEQRHLTNENARTIISDNFIQTSDGIFFSVIIPTYNRMQLLPGIIDSWKDVYAHTSFSFEIIFSDDGSSDGSAEYLESIEGLPIKVLRNAHGGASSARNAAIKAACGKRLLIIGDDIFPDRDILNIHAKIAQKLGRNVAILGAVDWHDDIYVNHLMQHITEIGNEQFSYNRLPENSFVDFRHFYTCNISIDRTFVLEEKTIFDERFDEYGFEDIELGYRLALKGLKIHFAPQAKGAHFHPYNIESFCRRQTSSGRMAVRFINIHPGIDRLLCLHILSQRALQQHKSSGQDAVWLGRVDMLTQRCNDYENLVAHLSSDTSSNIIRQCLSAIYARLFKAMYEYGVLDQLGNHENPLAIAMAHHFGESWADYWELLTQTRALSTSLKSNEYNNLVEALNAGDPDHLIFGTEQRAMFDELAFLMTKPHTSYPTTVRSNTYLHLFFRTLHYLTHDPRYLVYRARQALLSTIKRDPVFVPQLLSGEPTQAAMPALVLDANTIDCDKVIDLFRTTFGDSALVYTRTEAGLLIPRAANDDQAEAVTPLRAEANIFFWPTSAQTIPLRGHLLNAYMALIENKLNIAVVSNGLNLGSCISIGNLRDHTLFSRDIAVEIFNNTLNEAALTGKVLRLLPTNGFVKEQSLEAQIGAPINIDNDGFFTNSSPDAMPSIRYKAAYLPSHLKEKPVVFVFPIFLAVGGVERNTVEIMRQLQDRFDFVVITMERLRAEQGSLAAQAIEVAHTVIEMSEIASHDHYLRVLTRLKANFQPDLIWVCNGSPWFCDNAQAIRQMFFNLPIIDQEVYDVQQGWISRYLESGIQSFDRFIAVNKKIEERFVSEFKMDPARIHLIYSAIDTDRIRNFKKNIPNPTTLSEKFGLPENKKLFSFIGRLTNQKRPLEFLSLAKMRLLHDEEFFVLVGDGELAPEAMNFIKQNGLTNVKRIPYIENTLELHAISSGIVFTSAYEGLPIAMIEALAMGVPAFSTDVGDISSILTEYGAGTVIAANISENLLQDGFSDWLSKHQSFVKSLQLNEDNIMDRFSSIRISQQYLNCWSSAMEQYGKSAP